jgi:hypothetical protein
VEIATIFEPKIMAFSAGNKIISKICQLLQGYVLRKLQYILMKFCKKIDFQNFLFWEM